MSLISYAQNFEDVMLWRALKHVENGFYIDIGAQDPVVDSVSLAFYEQGWRGIHVEPVIEYVNQLATARPDEVVIPAAVGNNTGLLTFFIFPDTGLSTADPGIAQRHKESGFQCIETKVPVISLDEIFATTNGRQVHWLKLDVEGFEKSVIQSWRKSVVKPWILLIESTLPLTQKRSHHQWERLITSHGYEFVYFDGLNCYYISSEHPELKGAFATGPNLFDGFHLSSRSSSPFCTTVEVAHESNTQPETQLYHCAVKIQMLSQKLHQRDGQIEGLSRDMGERDTRIETLSQKLSDRDAWFEQLSQNLAERDSKLETLSHELTERDDKLETLLQELTERDDKLEALLQELAGRDSKLEELSKYLDDRDARIERLSCELSECEANIESLTQDACARTVEIDQLVQKAAELVSQVELGKQSTHHWWQSCDNLCQELEASRNALAAVHASTSWRLTAPLRWLSTIVIYRCWRRIKTRLKIILSKLASFVNRRPRLRRMALRIIYRIPRLKFWLVRAIGSPSAPPALSMQEAPSFTNISSKIETKKTVIPPQISSESEMPAGGQHLTPHARRLYRTIRLELLRNSKEKH